MVDAFGIKIGELPASKVYLFKEQSHKGRCIVASKFHVSELVNLSEADRNAFMADVCSVRMRTEGKNYHGRVLWDFLQNYSVH